MDTLVGPYLKNGNTSTQAKLIAFIDDASRVVPHGQFFFAETTDNLIVALKAALYKRGIPQTLYVDKRRHLHQPGDQPDLRETRHRALPHPRARRSRERKNRKIFQNRSRPIPAPATRPLLPGSPQPPVSTTGSRTTITPAFHGTLQMKPIDRFGLDLQRLRFLNPLEATDELFYVEQERTVRKGQHLRHQQHPLRGPRDLARPRSSTSATTARTRTASSSTIKASAWGKATRLDFPRQ